jgi:hypothetical protein
VLGSLISGDSQNRATASRVNIAGMRDATDRRGQDLKSSAQADALGIAKDRNTTQSEYYHTLGDIGKERNSIARDEMDNRYSVGKKIDPVEAQNRRLEIINSDGLKTLYGENVWNSMDSDQKSRAKGEYYQTGRIKDYEADNWLTRKLPFTDAEFKGNIDEKAGVPTPYRNAPTQQQPKQEAFKLDTNQTNAVLSDFAQEKGYSLSDLTEKNGVVSTPDGDFPLSVLWEAMNGGK